MHTKYICLFFLAIVITSCVGNKRIVYLQNDDLKNNDEIIKDSVLRAYELSFEDYTIQPQDILMVEFNSLTDEEYDIFEDFSNNFGGGGGGAGLLSLRGELVNPAGYINFPLLGNIYVKGKTIFEIQDELQNKAALYVEDPAVKVRLLNFRFTLLGEVNGENTITTQNTRITFMEALSLGGGLSELADRKNVKVIRQRGDKAEIFYVNLLNEEFIASDKFYVYQNDIIVVPPLPQRPVRRYYGQNLGLLVTTVSAILLFYNIFIQ